MATPLIGPDGKRYFVDRAEDLQGAINAGYRVETAEAPQTFGESAQGVGSDALGMLGAATQGVARGFSAGLSDLLIAPAGESPSAADPLDPSGDIAASRRAAASVDASRLRKENPISFGLGEFGGMVASPINKVGAAVRGGIGATTALGRIGASALAEGAEGLLYGAGNTMSDAALGDYDITAEKMIAGVGLGGVLGLAGGGIGAGLAEGFKAVVPKVGKAIAGIKEPLLEIRDLFGMKAAGAMGKDFRAAAHRDNTRELVDLLIDKGVMKAGGKVDDVADKAVELAAATGKRQGDLAALIESAGGSVNGAKVADEFDALAAKYLDGNVGDQGIGRRLTAEAEAIRAKGEIPFTKAEEAKRGFDKFLEFGAEQGPMQEGLKKARGILNAEIEASAKKTGLSEVDQWLTAKKEMGLLAQVRDFSVARAEGLKANRFLSLSDHLVGVGGGVAGAVVGGYGGGTEGAIGGLALGLSNKLLRERLPALIALAADKIAKSPRLMVAATSFGNQLQAAAPNLGQYAAPLLQAYARSPANGLATHIAQAQTDPEYAKAAQLAGFLPETTEEQAHADRKGDTLAAVAHTLDVQNTDISKGLDAVMRGTRAPSTPSQTQDFGSKRMRAKDSLTAHGRRVDEIRELAANPEALLERVTKNMGDLSELAPGVAGSMTKTAHAAVAYLAKASEEPPKAGPMSRAWVPSEAERYEFAQKLESVERPMSVLKHAAAGTLTPARWEAVQTVYPLLARQIRDMAMERLADPPKDVPYRARLMLGMITGIDVDGSMGPAIALNQQAIDAANSKESSMSPDDAKKRDLTLGARTATPNQRREMETQK